MRVQRLERPYKRRQTIHLFLSVAVVIISIWLQRTVSSAVQQHEHVGNEGLCANQTVVGEGMCAWTPSSKKIKSTKPKAPSIESNFTGFEVENRSFTLHPITAQESEALTLQDKSGITAAICHPTLFGDIPLDPLFAFVSYYRLLGFDHVFFWYQPTIANLSRFDELNRLPYVTMTPYMGHASEHGHAQVEQQCLSHYAANYDWALNIDADEYLWFHTSMSVKEFLSNYHANYTYLSFGKWMYTMRHAVEVTDSSNLFGLDSYAFTAKSYCMHYSNHEGVQNFTYCPSILGRSKVLVKPLHHQSVFSHGTRVKFSWNGLMHFDTRTAHLKEWRSLFRKDPKLKVRPSVSFNESSRLDVADLKHAFESHELVDGKLVMHYDSNLHDWMRFVGSGCSKN